MFLSTYLDVVEKISIISLQTWHLWSQKCQHYTISKNVSTRWHSLSSFLQQRGFTWLSVDVECWTKRFGCGLLFAFLLWWVRTRKFMFSELNNFFLSSRLLDTKFPYSFIAKKGLEDMTNNAVVSEQVCQWGIF